MTFPGRLLAVQPPPEWRRPELPAFNAQAACTACGEWEVRTEYCGGIVIKLPPQLPYLLKFVWVPSRRVCLVGGPRPHLHRICSRCSYTWAERTVNDAMVEVWRK